MFIAVLSTFAGAAKPFDPEIVIRPLQIERVGWRVRIEHRDGDRAGMDSAAFFARRTALMPVSAGFIGKLVELIAIDF